MSNIYFFPHELWIHILFPFLIKCLSFDSQFAQFLFIGFFHMMHFDGICSPKPTPPGLLDSQSIQLYVFNPTPSPEKSWNMWASKWTTEKTKITQTKQINNKSRHKNVEFILCCPATSEHEACSGVWLIFLYKLWMLVHFAVSCK